MSGQVLLGDCPFCRLVEREEGNFGAGFVSFCSITGQSGSAAVSDDTEYVVPEEEKGFFQDQTKLTYFLVLPLFCLCYGGTCCIYTVGKTWR